ncbi:MAG TPA: putative glycolipid-binding domain-containing protein, partial [Gaiellaceae bacterium]|nr:putative glycolipid-binding domain-containing protein [Gaiellaceae bacterium]
LFDGAFDPDLGLSPLFNTMPVLRHRLHDGKKADEFLMVWISVPDLALHPSPQRYTHLERRGVDERVVRFEAVGDGFVADVVFDREGLVVDYPGIATRVRPSLKS